MPHDETTNQTPTPRRRGTFTDVRHVAQTGSTNEDVLALGRAGEPEGVVLVAAEQLAGRGRHGRRWVAPAGAAALCSVLLRPPAPVAPLITATLALAADDALRSLGARGVGIKWPNDLVVSGDDLEGATTRKVAGILAEADWPSGSSIAAGHRAPRPTDRALVVAGIGINVTTPHGQPAEWLDTAVWLDELVGHPLAVEDVVEALLDALDLWYERLRADRSQVLSAWRARCVTVGASVRVDLGAEVFEGTAVDLDTEGRLIVDAHGGRRRVIAAGDVVHLRPATG